MTGAAVNTYYHKTFTPIVVKESGREPTPGKLWERTENYTAEDGCIAGAAAGVATFLPTLFMRRISVPWWTRLLGMATIGASTGIVASQAYFQYTGERQKALEELDRQRRRRSLEFHYIFWNKLMMARFDPLIQQYVRHNGVFRAYHIPAEIIIAPDTILPKVPMDKNATTDASATPAVAEARHYQPPQDHARILKNMDVDRIIKDRDIAAQERRTLLKEAEYIYYELTGRQYLLCTTTYTNEDDRQKYLRELQLISIIYNRLRSRAEDLDRTVYYSDMWLQQKTALDANDARAAWLSSTSTVDPESHDPTIFIAEAKKLADQYVGETKHWEAFVNSQATEDVAKRSKYIAELGDARMLLKAADQVAFDMEKKAAEVAKRKSAAVKGAEKLEPGEPGEPEKS